MKRADKRSPKYSHQDDLRVQVTYEVTFKLYETLKIRDDIKILNKNDKTYDVQMNLNPNEAIDLCFQYHRSLRLISPDHLLKQFTVELIKLQMIYLRNEV